jgi:hypothetical protein
MVISGSGLLLDGGVIAQLGGTTDATSGAMRLANNANISWRDSNGSYNFQTRFDFNDNFVLTAEGTGGAEAILSFDGNDNETATLNVGGGPTVSGSAASGNAVDLGGGDIGQVGGQNDASAGAVRLSNGSSILARNSADTDNFGITFTLNDAVAIDTDITDGANTIYDYANNWVPQARLENDSVTVAGNAVSLGGSTAVNHGDIANIGADDHHARDHAGRHGFGNADELATALRYEPEAEPSTPSTGVVRWYDSTADAFKAKFDDGTSVTLAQK